MNESNAEASETINNDLFERLPFLGEALLAHLDLQAVLQLSSTCRAWRQQVQMWQVQLAPKSELAMPFIAGCLHLKHLQLSLMLPGPPRANSNEGLLSLIAHLTHLTHLDLAHSLTAAWRHQAVPLDSHDLQHLAGLTALQVLILAHQPCLLEPDSLVPLAHLLSLTSLNLNITHTSWHPPAAAWAHLQHLTGLVHLDLSGWSLCRWCLRPQQQTETEGIVTPQAAGAGAGTAAVRGIDRVDGHLASSSSNSNVAGSWLLRLRLQLQQERHHHSSGVRSKTDGCASGGGGGGGGGPAMITAAAPLALLCGLTRLQRLVLADWDEPPSCAGLAAVWGLPSLTFLDLSRCWQHPTGNSLQPGAAAGGGGAGGGGAGPPDNNNNNGTAVRQPGALLSLLQGTTRHQQQQQQLHLLHLTAAAGSSSSSEVAPTGLSALPMPAAAMPAAAPAAAASFTRLLQLHCSGVDVSFDAGDNVWAALSGLTHLDVSACSRLRGQGLNQLTALQELVASDCLQLDYDCIKQLLVSTRKLVRLDLQRSTVILHGAGTTATQLSSGRYSRPLLSTRHQQHQQRQQQQLRGSLGASSRRDVVDLSGVDRENGAPAAAAAGDIAASGVPLCGQPNSRTGAGGSPWSYKGLQELFMDECQLAFEAFVWHPEPNDPQMPAHPSLLLYDLVASSAQQLQDLRVLHWNRADAVLASTVLSQLVPHASSSLTELLLGSCRLPDDVGRCWQGLAAATRLRILDLNYTGFSRQGFATNCGTNHTVSLLAAAARMRLARLGVAGWRFYFASFMPLAGLSDCLMSLDLSHAVDVTESTLWSLTHLTSLTWLSVAGAQASSDQTFPLLFTFFSGLRHLELTGVKNFTARSLPSVLQLQALTCLDIRSTQATADAAAVRTLVKLPNCRRLMLSVAGDEGYGRHQWLPEVTSSRGAGAGAAAAAGGGGWHYDTSTTDSSAGEGLEAYACLRELGRAQSLRQLVLGGSTPTLTEYCRSLLPPWIDVR